MLGRRHAGGLQVIQAAFNEYTTCIRSVTEGEEAAAVELTDKMLGRARCLCPYLIRCLWLSEIRYFVLLWLFTGNLALSNSC